MKLILCNLIAMGWALFAPGSSFAGKRIEEGSVTYYNQSTNIVFVTELVFDKKRTGASCGYLSPNVSATIVGFPRSIPETFEIQYRDSNGTTRAEKLDATWIRKALEANKTATQAELYFILTFENQFITKLYLSSGGTPSRDGKLLPDESDPKFKAYKELVRSTIEGNTVRVLELLTNGTPYAWPNNPISLTPLESSVRWNQKATFEVLIERVPQDFYAYNYYSCIRKAVGANNDDMLKRLLQSDLAKDVPESPLQEIFYSACSRRSSPPTLKLLLDHFKVGIDYKVRDHGHTLLFAAVQDKNEEMVEWLLKQGANPNVKLQSGGSPLEWARTEKIKNLLQEYGGK